jgi:hypothetical protein
MRSVFVMHRDHLPHAWHAGRAWAAVVAYYSGSLRLLTLCSWTVGSVTGLWEGDSSTHTDCSHMLVTGACQQA